MESVHHIILVPTPFDDAVAQTLVAELRDDLAHRYGSYGRVDTSPEQFTPPHGIFLVAWFAGHPVGCAGVREVDTGVGEVKRMYVRPSARRQGIAHELLRELENLSYALGARRLRLTPGPRQPEAVRLYESAGWSLGELYGEALTYGWTDAPIFERELGPSDGSR